MGYLSTAVNSPVLSSRLERGTVSATQEHNQLNSRETKCRFRHIFVADAGSIAIVISELKPSSNTSENVLRRPGVNMAQRRQVKLLWDFGVET